MSGAGGLLALSIDLDAVELYTGLHGRDGALAARARDAVPALAVQRFGELCARLGVPGTLFVVGRDAAEGRGAAQLRAALAAGHELASHSFGHDYALSRLARIDIDADLNRAQAALEALGAPGPHGFRAPGYTLSDGLLDALAARGAPYDSSLLPSAPYYALKAAVMAAVELRGGRSRAILGPVRDTWRARGPQRLRPGLVELPVAVLPGLRAPYIGTTMALAPELFGAAAARALARDALVTVELHGVDLCGPDDGVPPLQPDLRLPAGLKLRRIEAAVRALLAGRRAVTLAQAARLVSPADPA
jgi:peptidoglycan/xylan/chitin deacetylase (PgdA/CDA1 family)